MTSTGPCVAAPELCRTTRTLSAWQNQLVVTDAPDGAPNPLIERVRCDGFGYCSAPTTGSIDVGTAALRHELAYGSHQTNHWALTPGDVVAPIFLSLAS